MATSQSSSIRSRSGTAEYREVVGHPGYWVGSDGTVWSQWAPLYVPGVAGRTSQITGRWRLLRTGSNPKSGHLQVRLRGKDRYVHHLVLEAFVGPRPPDTECRHLDDNPRNNRLGNLQWGTRSENIADRVVTGRHVCGERQGNAVLTEFQVREIRSTYASGAATQRAIAGRFGICQQTVSDIVRGLRWAHLL